MPSTALPRARATTRNAAEKIDQVITSSGSRARPDHLYRQTRNYANLQPRSFENPARGLGNGHSYRNAAIHVLLHSPIFVDFVRSHSRRITRKPSHKVCDIKASPVEGDCLLCAMDCIRRAYWESGLGVDAYAERNRVLREFWDICRATFWTRAANADGQGMADPDQEHYVFSFLLRLLAHIRRQLNDIPSELQTFHQIFTIHYGIRWICQKGCDWRGTIYKDANGLFFDLALNIINPRTKTTSVTTAIKVSLDNYLKTNGPGPDDQAAETCGICKAQATAKAFIINYPELLILHNGQHTQFGSGPASLKCSGQEVIRLEELTDPVIAQHHKTGSQYLAGDRHYRLIAMAGEHLRDDPHPRTMAIIKSSDEAKVPPDWCGILDEITEPVDLDTLEQNQQLRREGVKSAGSFLPEILILRREDEAGWRNLGTGNSLFPDAASPHVLDQEQQDRDLVARSRTDIFNRHYGKSLFSFKLKFGPTDPAPSDRVPLSLELRYQYGRCSWATRINADLDPFDSLPADADKPEVTPWAEDIYIRHAQNRQPAPKLESGQPYPFNPSIPDGMGWTNAINPFAIQTLDAGEMEVEYIQPPPIMQLPHVRQVFEDLENENFRDEFNKVYNCFRSARAPQKQPQQGYGSNNKNGQKQGQKRKFGQKQNQNNRPNKREKKGGPSNHKSKGKGGGRGRR